MRNQITIAKRFCGPPRSGNGGYVCGSLAAFVEGTAEVTLRRPPPLDRPLFVEREDGLAYQAAPPRARAATAPPCSYACTGGAGRGSRRRRCPRRESHAIQRRVHLRGVEEA